MRYVAAYLLAGLGGKEHPTAEEIEAILKSVGVECNKERLNQVINELKGKKIEDLIAAGKEKLSPIFNPPTAENGAVEAAEESPKEEVKKDAEVEKHEETEESDDDLGFGLFD